MDRNPRTIASNGSTKAVGPVNDGNRVSTVGAQVQPTPNQLAGSFANTIPANSTIPVSIQGSFFYMQACSAPVQIKAGGSDFEVYAPGTGYKMPDQPQPDGTKIPGSFSLIQVRNPNNFPVAFAVFIGFGEYIDNRVILQQGLQFPIMKVTYSGTPAVAGPILIPDISGQAFNDENGVTWLAISRTVLYIDNLSTVSNLTLLNSTSAVINPGNCGTIFPSTTRTFPVSGGFSLNPGGGPVQACVIEIYNAITPNIPL